MWDRAYSRVTDLPDFVGFAILGEMWRWRLSWLVVLGSTLGVAATPTAYGDDETVYEIIGGPISRAEAPADSRSVGWVYRGHLENGQRLEASEHIHHVERFAEHGRFFGTPGLVGLLERAARAIAEAHGPSRLNVGELSQEGGGDVVGHRSHENGRDVDVGFYLLDAEGNSVEPDHFVRVGAGLAGGDGEKRVTFDSARNWSLIEALVTDAETPVQMIFVSARIRRHLVRWARQQRIDPEIVERAEWTMVPPHGVARHDDHFHVRIYCEPDQRDVCEDRGPYWRWVPETHVPEDVEVLPRFWTHD
jgi:penicillin-insensitive murein endopeptidase